MLVLACQPGHPAKLIYVSSRNVWANNNHACVYSDGQTQPDLVGIMKGLSTDNHGTRSLINTIRNLPSRYPCFFEI
jgi:hypothetical protein